MLLTIAYIGGICIGIISVFTGYILISALLEKYED